MTQTRQGYALADQEGQAIWFLGTLSTIKANSEQTHFASSIHVEVVPCRYDKISQEDSLR